MDRLIVDRVEEGIVVLEKEAGGHIKLSVDSIEFSLNEGDVLLFDGVKYLKSESEKDERRKKLLSMQQKLKEKQKNK